MAQPLLHTGQHRRIVARLDMNHPAWRQAGLFQPRREQIGLRHAPEHLPGQARGDPSGKTGRRRAIGGAIAAARDLVQLLRQCENDGLSRIVWEIEGQS